MSDQFYTGWLPPCPGVNELYGRTRQGGVYKKSAAKQYQQDATLLLRKDGLLPYPEGKWSVEVVIDFATWRQDSDAPVKLLLDIIKGVIAVDDRFFHILHILKTPTKKGEEVVRITVVGRQVTEDGDIIRLVRERRNELSGVARRNSGGAAGVR